MTDPSRGPSARAGGTRRRAGGERTGRPDLRGFLPALVPLLVLGVVVVAGPGVAPADDAPRAGRTPVDEVVQACLRMAEPAPDTTILTVAVPAPPAAAPAEGGRVAVGTGTGAAPEVVADAARGERVTLEVTGEGVGATTLEATGGAAAGRSTLRVDRGPRGLLAVQECDQPRAHWWFTGAGAGLDHTSVLLLGNPDPGPAVLDVRVLGLDGPVESVGTRGVTLAPGETRALDLLEIAPQGDELAVEVKTSRGRVVAAVADAYARSAGVRAGSEWLPAQVRAARRLRLGPLAPRTGPQTLVVANPVAREAVVEVEVAGAGGTFAPTDLSALRVPPESVATVDLPRDVRQEAATLLLRSTTPVTATVRTLAGNDHAYAAVLEPLGAPAQALLPDGPEALLELTAGERAASAAVRALAADGSTVRARTIELGPAATVGWRVPARAASVVVDVAEGRVVGAVALGGRGASQVPLGSATFAVVRPAVVPAPR